MRFKNEKAGFIFFFPKWQILRCIEGPEDGAGIQKIQNKELSWRMGKGLLGQPGSRRGREAGGGTLPSPVPPAAGRRGVSLLAAQLVRLEASLHRAVWRSLSVILFTMLR